MCLFEGEEESQSQVQTCVFTSCLLAKFLGMIVFAPFQSSTALQPDTLQAQILVRQQVSQGPVLKLVFSSYLSKTLLWEGAGGGFALSKGPRDETINQFCIRVMSDISSPNVIDAGPDSRKRIS